MLGQRTRSFRFLCASLVFVLAHTSTGPFYALRPANAQALLTVLAVKDALTSAIDEFRKAASQLTNDLQSLGNSLQANAQNVLQDIDKILGDKLNLTFDRLEAQERQLAESAQSLIRQINFATQAIISKSGDEARKTITEADITAYNTSYSLPCRDARPRIISALPARIILSQDVPVIALRGNFLRQGSNLTAAADGREARIVERPDTSIKIELPKELFDPLPPDTKVVSLTVRGARGNRQTYSFIRIIWLPGKKFGAARRFCSSDR